MAIVVKDKYKKEVKVTDDPFKDLEKIIDMEFDGKSVGWRLRREALQEWMKKWVVEVENEISVLSEDLFTSEYKDHIKDTLVFELAQKMTEETEFVQNKNRMRAKVKMIRRKPCS